MPRREKAFESEPAKLQYLVRLGISPVTETALFQAIFKSLDDPLPEPWEAHTDAKGRSFFFNPTTSISSWVHPSDSLFREVAALSKDISGSHDPKAASIEALQKLQQVKENELHKWREVSTDDGQIYFVNVETRNTQWHNPRGDLLQQIAYFHVLLTRLVEMSRPASSSSSPQAKKSLAVAADSTQGSASSKTEPADIARQNNEEQAPNKEHLDDVSQPQQVFSEEREEPLGQVPFLDTKERFVEDIRSKVLPAEMDQNLKGSALNPDSCQTPRPCEDSCQTPRPCEDSMEVDLCVIEPEQTQAEVLQQEEDRAATQIQKAFREKKERNDCAKLRDLIQENILELTGEKDMLATTGDMVEKRTFPAQQSEAMVEEIRRKLDVEEPEPEEVVPEKAEWWDVRIGSLANKQTEKVEPQNAGSGAKTTEAERAQLCAQSTLMFMYGSAIFATTNYEHQQSLKKERAVDKEHTGLEMPCVDEEKVPEKFEEEAEEEEQEYENKFTEEEEDEKEEKDAEQKSVEQPELPEEPKQQGAFTLSRSNHTFFDSEEASPEEPKQQEALEEPKQQEAFTLSRSNHSFFDSEEVSASEVAVAEELGEGEISNHAQAASIDHDASESEPTMAQEPETAKSSDDSKTRQCKYCMAADGLCSWCQKAGKSPLGDTAKKVLIKKGTVQLLSTSVQSPKRKCRFCMEDDGLCRWCQQGGKKPLEGSLKAIELEAKLPPYKSEHPLAPKVCLSCKSNQFSDNSSLLELFVRANLSDVFWHCIFQNEIHQEQLQQTEQQNSWQHEQSNLHDPLPPHMQLKLQEMEQNSIKTKEALRPGSNSKQVEAFLKELHGSEEPLRLGEGNDPYRDTGLDCTTSSLVLPREKAERVKVPPKPAMPDDICAALKDGSIARTSTPEDPSDHLAPGPPRVGKRCWADWKESRKQKDSRPLSAQRGQAPRFFPTASFFLEDMWRPQSASVERGLQNETEGLGDIIKGLLDQQESSSTFSKTPSNSGPAAKQKDQSSGKGGLSKKITEAFEPAKKLLVKRYKSVENGFVAIAGAKGFITRDQWVEKLTELHYAGEMDPKTMFSLLDTRQHGVLVKSDLLYPGVGSAGINKDLPSRDPRDAIIAQVLTEALEEQQRRIVHATLRSLNRCAFKKVLAPNDSGESESEELLEPEEPLSSAAESESSSECSEDSESSDDSRESEDVEIETKKAFRKEPTSPVSSRDRPVEEQPIAIEEQTPPENKEQAPPEKKEQTPPEKPKPKKKKKEAEKKQRKSVAERKPDWEKKLRQSVAGIQSMNLSKDAAQEVSELIHNIPGMSDIQIEGTELPKSPRPGQHKSKQSAKRKAKKKEDKKSSRKKEVPKESSKQTSDLGPEASAEPKSQGAGASKSLVAESSNQKSMKEALVKEASPGKPSENQQPSQSPRPLEQDVSGKHSNRKMHNEASTEIDSSRKPPTIFLQEAAADDDSSAQPSKETTDDNSSAEQSLPVKSDPAAKASPKSGGQSLPVKSDPAAEASPKSGAQSLPVKSDPAAKAKKKKEQRMSNQLPKPSPRAPKASPRNATLEIPLEQLSRQASRQASSKSSKSNHSSEDVFEEATMVLEDPSASKFEKRASAIQAIQSIGQTMGSIDGNDQHATEALKHQLVALAQEHPEVAAVLEERGFQADEISDLQDFQALMISSEEGELQEEKESHGNYDDEHSERFGESRRRGVAVPRLTAEAEAGQDIEDTDKKIFFQDDRTSNAAMTLARFSLELGHLTEELGIVIEDDNSLNETPDLTEEKKTDRPTTRESLPRSKASIQKDLLLHLSQLAEQVAVAQEGKHVVEDDEPVEGGEASRTRASVVAAMHDLEELEKLDPKADIGKARASLVQMADMLDGLGNAGRADMLKLIQSSEPPKQEKKIFQSAPIDPSKQETISLSDPAAARRILFPILQGTEVSNNLSPQKVETAHVAGTQPLDVIDMLDELDAEAAVPEPGLSLQDYRNELTQQELQDLDELQASLPGLPQTSDLKELRDAAEKQIEIIMDQQKVNRSLAQVILKEAQAVRKCSPDRPKPRATTFMAANRLLNAGVSESMVDAINVIARAEEARKEAIESGAGDLQWEQQLEQAMAQLAEEDPAVLQVLKEYGWDNGFYGGDAPDLDDMSQSFESYAQTQVRGRRQGWGAQQWTDRLDHTAILMGNAELMNPTTKTPPEVKRERHRNAVLAGLLEEAETGSHICVQRELKKLGVSDAVLGRRRSIRTLELPEEASNGDNNRSDLDKELQELQKIVASSEGPQRMLATVPRSNVQSKNTSQSQFATSLPMISGFDKNLSAKHPQVSGTKASNSRSPWTKANSGAHGPYFTQGKHSRSQVGSNVSQAPDGVVSETKPESEWPAEGICRTYPHVLRMVQAPRDGVDASWRGHVRVLQNAARGGGSGLRKTPQSQSCPQMPVTVACPTLPAIQEVEKKNTISKFGKVSIVSLPTVIPA